MELKKQFLLAVCLTTLASCGQNSPLEERCDEASCTEAGINAPKFPPSVNEGPGSNLPPQSGNYRMPAFDSNWGLKEELFKKTADYYEENYSNIPNKRYVTIIDFNQHSSKKRFYLFDLETGVVEQYQTSHGTKSDTDNDGFATQFSNTINSRQSSLGFYLTLGTYMGGHGYSLRLRGLEDSNSNAEVRAIVMHPANYVREEKNYTGRSWGCPALDPSISKSVIDRVREGSLLFMGK